MARNLLKRLIPSAATIKSNPALHFLGDVLHDPNLFHLNRHSVSVAVFWGMLVAFLPIPGQMPLAALAALYFRCNLPLSCALVWISNPLTMPFFFFVTYSLGRIILRMDPIVFAAPPEMSWEWVSHELLTLWYPLYIPLMVGGIAFGIISGALSYVGMQFFWRWRVIREWNNRKQVRANRAAGSE